MTRTWFRTVLYSALLGSAFLSGAAEAETVVLRGGSVYASPDAARCLMPLS